MQDVVLAGATRTPIGKFLGGLSSLTAPQLGAIVVREALRRAGVRVDDVDEVILGNVLGAGLGQNPARQAAMGAGLPPRVPALTINKVCGSGLKAVALAVQAIKAGDAEVIVAGGMESMSNAPYLLPGARTGQRLGHGTLVDAMIHDGLWDKYNDFHMGITAELVADKYHVTRAAQDAFAVESQRRAVAAQKAGKFAAEIVAVEIPQRKGAPLTIGADESPRADVTTEGLAKLAPAFKKDGTVTAANSSSISDGASAVVVLSARKAAELGVQPQARVTGYATGGVAPEWVMMAPLEAVKNLEKKTGLAPQAFDLVEINEAFASAACALLAELKLAPERVNPNGGAVALGHPIGATGCRILTTLIYGLLDRKASRGLASLCLGGGNAVAMSVEAMKQ